MTEKGQTLKVEALNNNLDLNLDVKQHSAGHQLTGCPISMRTAPAAGHVHRHRNVQSFSIIIVRQPTNMSNHAGARTLAVKPCEMVGRPSSSCARVNPPPLPLLLG